MAYIAMRYVFAVMGMFGMGITYGLMVNLSVAIVSMVDHREIYASALAKQNNSVARNLTNVKCAYELEDDEPLENGPFDWSCAMQGVILSSYFWGYMLLQMPGARMAERVSAKYTMCLAVAVNVICTVCIPICAETHVAAMILMRVGQGLGGGVTFPAMHVLISHWAPEKERGLISSIVYTGSVLGIATSLFTTGLIASELSWKYVFYITGGVGVPWIFCWILLVADSPQKLKCMSKKERAYIDEELEKEGIHQDANVAVPWKQVFKTAAFWAILIAHTCSNWGWYLVITVLPMYLRTALQYHVFANALISALPFVALWIFSLVLAKILDTIKAKCKMSTTVAKKVATFIASAIPMICFTLLCYIGCARHYAIVLLTIAITSMGGMFCGFLSNHIDIGPNFAGSLIAVTNTVATMPGIVVPMVMGTVVGRKLTEEAWHLIFSITVGLYCIEMFTYLIFGSGKEKAWNRLDPSI